MKQAASAFRKLTEATLDKFLGGYGFGRTRSQASQDGFGVTYRSGQQYIHIGGTLHPHDYPYYYYFKLGEGGDAFPESDWNGVALWRIIQHVSPTEYQKHERLYEIPDEITDDEIAAKLQTNRELCVIYAADFLSGDLERFHVVRSAQNRGREPYRIYTPDANGKYSMRYDDESQRLKVKYS